MLYTATCYILHDDDYYLAESIASFRAAGDVIVFVSRVPWHDQPGDWERAVEVARQAGAAVVIGDWPTELAQRQAAFQVLWQRGYTHALIPDGDEIVEPDLLDSLLTIAEQELAERVSVTMDTYWKSPEYVIRPREPLTPVMLVDLRNAHPTGLRNFAGGRPLVLSAEHGVLHHLSYVGPDERIRRKIATWGHRDEVLPGWYERVWLGWDGDKLLRNLHPTHPQAYGFTERIHVPDLLVPALGRWTELEREGEELAAKRHKGAQREEIHGASGDAVVAVGWPKVSVVIPLHGGREDLRLCLDSLDRCADLLHEIVVVDNASPDDAVEEVLARAVPVVARDARQDAEKAETSDGTAPETSMPVLGPHPHLGISWAPLPHSLASSQGEGATAFTSANGDTTAPADEPRPTLSFTISPCDGDQKLPSPSEERASRRGAGGEVSLLRNERNEGFAAACNRGIAESSGDIVLFLNSDTVVPRVGLARLVEALTCSGSIGAAGPFTNYAGHGQQIAPTYTSLDTMELFAEDFAALEREDVETDMLVGFCLAVRRSVLREIGGFDERFGLGTFEDNDLCYRMRRAGYRLVIAANSFVHHSGSKTMRRMAGELSPQISQITQIRDGKVLGLGEAARGRGFDIGALLRRNEGIYREKWREDLESGFASTLSGLGGERIVFDAQRHPERRLRRIQKDSLRADISLCMIVKDEERVLGECLRSAKPFFREMIVVDTGSTDRTKEIAREMCARVLDFPWTNSFAEARNESLKYAKGRWIFWMDADDTISIASGEALLEAALNAPAEVVGFVVPVQFVEEGEGSGTRVDHVKLFRNKPDVRFEGRIHEQILASLRPHGQIARCGAVVMHSGYDTSPEGQAKKRVRDALLLKLDLEERPDHPFVLFNLGMTDYYGGEHASAIGWLARCLGVSAPTDSHVRKAYALLALSQRQAGDVDGCLETLRKGLSIVPDDPELHFHLAHTLTERGELQGAKEHYEQTLKCRMDDHFSSVDIGILGYKTIHNLASVCLMLGDYRSARGWWRKAIEAAPRFLPSVFSLFDAAMEAGDLATAKQMVEAAHKAEGSGENWLRMGLRLAEALSGVEGTDAFLRQALAEHSRSPLVGMAWARHLLQTGREAQARAHLHPLAEAAYFLGVFAIRVGALEEALAWMERAEALNPEHDETKSQIASLNAALGQAESAAGPALTLSEAVTQVAADLGLDREALWSYTQEDTVGGYRRQDAEAETPAWPGGSVWEDEGRLLYGLVRALKPERIVEIGSLVGCSTSHLALACRRNGSGKVYAVDPALELSRVDAELLEYIVPVTEDVFAWDGPGAPISLLFEDGAHSPGFTRAALEKLCPHLDAGGVVLSHDYHHARLGRHIAKEFDAVLAAYPMAVVGSARIAPSDCGLGYARLAISE